MAVKASRYNIFIESGPNSSFVYNTLKGSILSVDGELREYLEKNEISSIDPNLLTPLKEHGIIVDSLTDELKVHRLRHNQTKYNTARSSFLVFTTYSCNLQCPYCYEGAVVSEEHYSAYMGPEMTASVVTFVRNQTLRNRSYTTGIGLYGGEPLLNIECCSTILKQVSEWCRGNHINFYATITTNGTLLNQKNYDQIKKYLSSIHITLDGPQEYHDRKRIRKDGSGTYSEILNNLTLLKNTKEHLSIRISCDKENNHSLDKVLDDLEEIGLKERPYFHIYFAQVIPQNVCLTFPTDPQYRQMMEESIRYLPPLIEMAQEKGWKNHLAVDIGKEHCLVPMNVTSCDYVKHGCYSVDPYGDVYMCPASAGDTQYCIGKLCNGTVKWNSSYYNIITRDPTLISLCAECEFLPACGGGCALASYSRFRDYSAAFCNFNKEIISERIRAYLRFRYPGKFEE